MINFKCVFIKTLSFRHLLSGIDDEENWNMLCGWEGLRSVCVPKQLTFWFEGEKRQRKAQEIWSQHSKDSEQWQ